MKIVAHVKLSQYHPSVSTEFEMPDDSTKEEIGEACENWASEQVEIWWKKEKE